MAYVSKVFKDADGEPITLRDAKLLCVQYGGGMRELARFHRRIGNKPREEIIETLNAWREAKALEDRTRGLKKKRKRRV